MLCIFRVVSFSLVYTYCDYGWSKLSDQLAVRLPQCDISSDSKSFVSSRVPQFWQWYCVDVVDEYPIFEKGVYMLKMPISSSTLTDSLVSKVILLALVKIFSEDQWSIDIKIAELWSLAGGPGWQSAVAWVPIIMGDNKWWTFIGFIRRHHSPHHSYITRGQGGKLSSEEYKVLDIVGITFINLKSSNNKFYQTDQTRR